MTRKIYLASSWRNALYPDILSKLRQDKHTVYDFREEGFKWQELDQDWRNWSPNDYLEHVYLPRATEHFRSDRAALDWCDTCVLLLPCGRSAHLEAGYAIGKRKSVHVLLSSKDFEPELMYLLTPYIHTSVEYLRLVLKTPIAKEEEYV